MPSPNTIVFQNLYGNDTHLNGSVSTGGNNCVDNPSPGEEIGPVDFGKKSSEFFVCRKGGHGCDGGNGTFIMDITVGGVKDSQGFSINGGGDIGLHAPNPTQFTGTISTA